MQPEMYELRHDRAGVVGSHELLVSAFGALAVPEAGVPQGTYNVFMTMAYDPGGTYRTLAPMTETGEHVDLRDEVDLVVRLAACTYAAVVNDGEPRDLSVEILTP